MELVMRPIEETFAEMEQKIVAWVRRFERTKGGQFTELLSIAYDAFMHASRTYRPEKGPYEHWLKFTVWTEMLEVLRKDMGRNNRLPRRALDFANYAAKSHFDSEVFVNELTSDAAIVARLALESPAELGHAGRSPNPVRRRGAIEAFLARLGWAAERISDSFTEIREALQ